MSEKSSDHAGPFFARLLDEYEATKHESDVIDRALMVMIDVLYHLHEKQKARIDRLERELADLKAYRRD